MKKVFSMFLSLIVIFSLSQNAHAYKEDFGFIILDVPFGWTVLNKKENEIVLEDPNKVARFIYTVLPMHNVDLETYAKAIMQAYSGFNFKLIGSNIYSFNYLYLNKLATMRIHQNGRIACMQTTIGNHEEFESLLNAAELQVLPNSFFVNPDVEIPEKDD